MIARMGESNSDGNSSTVAIPSHPLNVKPSGNAYIASANAKQRTGVFELLADEIISLIIELLDASSLTIVGATCKFFYAFTRLDEFWKTLLLETIGSEKFIWQGSWRSTYLSAPAEKPRISCHDVYSDIIYRPFLCALTPLEPYTVNIPKGNAIQKVDDLSFSEFSSSWTDEPFVLTSPIKSWPVYNDWSITLLLQKYAQIKFRAEAVDWPLETYIDYLKNNQDESPLYLFDRAFAEKMDLEIGAKDGEGDYWPPSCFGSDLFTALGQDRPDSRWLIIGPKRSGSTFHKDPNATSAWNAVLRGSKYWLMFPPSITPPGVFVSSDGGEVTSPLSIAEYLLGFHAIARQTPGCKEAICGAGEVMHVPSGWWHLVVNLDSAIAITQNFVAEKGVKRVLRFLSERKDQVSGFHDNVKDPYDLFMQRLAEEWPAVLKEIGQGSKRKWDEMVKDLDRNDETDRSIEKSTGFTFGFPGGDSDEDVP